MIVIGLDPGFASTGFGVIDGDARRGWSRVASGVIATAPSRPEAARLAEIAADMAEILALHRPDAAAIEHVVAGQGKGQGASLTIKASGVLLAVLAGAGLAVAAYPPQSWKCGIGVSWREKDKDVIKVAVREILRLDYLPRTEHESDALAIAVHRGNRLEVGDAA